MTDETTLLPDPVAPPTRASRRRRTAGVAGQVAGIVGVVLALALAGGVLVGRGWLVDRVDAVAATLDAGIARTEPLLATSRATVGELMLRLDEAAAAAEAVAVDAAATPEALQGVLGRIAAVSERYLGLRNAYAGLREEVVSVLDRLSLLERLAPGFSVPPGPVDALASVDARARAIDATVMELIATSAARGTVNATAQTIGDRVRDAEAALAGISGGLDDIDARLAAVRADIAGVAATVSTAATLFAVTLVAVLLYVAFLHLVLWRAARDYGRDPAAA